MTTCEPCQERARDAAEVAVSAARIARLLCEFGGSERLDYECWESPRGHTTKPR